MSSPVRCTSLRISCKICSIAPRSGAGMSTFTCDRASIIAAWLSLPWFACCAISLIAETMGEKSGRSRLNLLTVCNTLSCISRRPNCDIHLLIDSSTTCSNSILENCLELGLGWRSFNRLSCRPSLRRRALRAAVLSGLCFRSSMAIEDSGELPNLDTGCCHIAWLLCHITLRLNMESHQCFNSFGHDRMGYQLKLKKTTP
mmetsp:Transcript_115922/g.181185  ORF Transcript_115922/g.181185 Transcript_115922/m.181185 type:complete len:201 (+) Transcript_115922:213-815(+)